MVGLVAEASKILRQEGPYSLFQTTKRFVYKNYLGRMAIILRFLTNSYKYDAMAHPYKVVHASPKKIENRANPFGYTNSVARVEDGTWDLKSKPLTDFPKYNAVVMRYEEGMDWSETGIYQHLLSEIEQRGMKDGCRNIADLKERYLDIDALYQNMKLNGYDLSHHGGPPPWWGSYKDDYIGVHIGRRGELIYANSGWHRLSISKVLEINTIPVWIRTRHKKWQLLRDTISNASSRDDLNDETIQYLTHPDMQDVVSGGMILANK